MADEPIFINFFTEHDPSLFASNHRFSTHRRSPVMSSTVLPPRRDPLFARFYIDTETGQEIIDQVIVGNGEKQFQDGDYQDFVTPSGPRTSSEYNFVIVPLMAFFIAATIIGNILILASLAFVAWSARSQRRGQSLSSLRSNSTSSFGAAESSMISTSNLMSPPTPTRRPHHPAASEAISIFTASLAIANLLVGCIVMPLAANLQAKMGYWPFGGFACDLWLASDVMMSTASILSITAICCRRYLAIARPYMFRFDPLRRGGCYAIFRQWLPVIVIWGSAFTVASPIVFGANRLAAPLTAEADGMCDFFSPDYVFFSSLVSFYIPCTAMALQYGAMLKVSLQHARKVAMRRQDILGRVQLLQANNVNSSSVSGTPIRHAAVALPVINHSPPCPSSPQTVPTMRRRRSSITLGGENHQSSATVVRAPIIIKEAVSSGSTDHLESEDRFSGDLDTEEQSSCVIAPPAHAEHQSPVAVPFRGGGGGGEEEAKKRPFNHQTILRTFSSREQRNSSIIFAQLPPPPPPSTPRLTKFSLDQSSSRQSQSRQQSIVSPMHGNSQQLRRKSRTVSLAVLKMKQQKRADRSFNVTLTVLLVSFFIAWLPFFGTNSLIWLNVAPPPPALIQFFIWLGYSNSMTNPLAYAICSADFRSAIRQLFSFIIAIILRPVFVTAPSSSLSSSSPQVRIHQRGGGSRGGGDDVSGSVSQLPHPSPVSSMATFQHVQQRRQQQQQHHQQHQHQQHHHHPSLPISKSNSSLINGGLSVSQFTAAATSTSASCSNANIFDDLPNSNSITENTKQSECD